MTSCYQWKRELVAKPQTSAFLRVITSEPTMDSIEIKLPEAGERLEAIGVREQPRAGVRCEARGNSQATKQPYARSAPSAPPPLYSPVKARGRRGAKRLVEGFLY